MDFTATNTTLWNFIIQLGIIAGVMLISNVMRRKIPLVRKSLMPTAVIAGFMMLLLKIVAAKFNFSIIAGFNLVDVQFMESLTYHAIAIGFIALSLQVAEKKDAKYKTDYTASKSGALIVSGYLLQGFCGMVLATVLSYTLVPGLFKASGILLAMGFGQGPGQANNVGLMYEKMGFTGGQSFGLSVAAAGFVCACVVGIIFLNVLKKQGKVVVHEPDDLSGSITVEKFEHENEIPVSESIDRLSIQFALIMLAYLLTFLFSFGVTSLLEKYAPGVNKTVSPLIWGFNFIIGSLMASIVKVVLKSLKGKKIMTRQYQNNYLLGRLSGVSFDLMIIGGTASINFAKLSGLWLYFALLCIMGVIITYFYLIWICKKLYPNYYYEGFLSMFGLLIGVISSGVILLREIDPDFKTPAANNMITASGFAILFAAPILLLISLAPLSDLMLFISLGIIAVYFAILQVFMLKVRKPKGKKGAQPVEADGEQPQL